jgi:SAM-dependent methyltransferase
LLFPNRDSLGSPNRFGSNWKKYNKLDQIYEEQFFQWISPLSKDDLNNKVILDAGCGIGRNSYYCLENGAKEVHLFDVEESTVEIAKDNLKDFDNTIIFKDSIYNQESVKNNTYDIVMSIGVIHHLSDPKIAISKLLEKVKQGGQLLIWVYGYEGNESLLKLLKLLRIFTTKLPYNIVAFLGKVFAFLMYLILKIYPTKSKYWSRAKKMRVYVLEQIIIDQLIPKIANYYSKNELPLLYNHINFENVQINNTNGNSWSILIKK